MVYLSLMAGIEPSCTAVSGNKTELVKYYRISLSHFFLLPFFPRDKLFPAFGFGAQVPPSWQVRPSQHCAAALLMSAFSNWY